MENKIIPIKNYRKKHFYKINYLDLNFWEVLQFAFLELLSIPSSSDYGKAPDTWNTIFYCPGVGQFDPNMMDSGRAEDFGMPAWTPWPEVNGSERTKLFIEKHAERILNLRFYKRIPNPTTSLQNKIQIMKDHFLYTKEEISENEIIINICYMGTKRYKRVHIKNYEKVKNLLSLKDKLNKIISPTYLNQTELKEIVVDGSSIKIEDESIMFVLTRLGFIDYEIYNTTPA